ncbi:MAG: chorismate synthase, partial [Acidobacteria bacterium]|nr:chorismate synthase [Acidobacteriota bacterium]
MRFLTSGDSHGRYITATVEGIPAGIPINKDFIRKELLRRSKCFGRSSRMAAENEEAEILCGVRKGLSTGNPLTIIIPNNEFCNLEEDEILKHQSDVLT